MQKWSHVMRASSSQDAGNFSYIYPMCNATQGLLQYTSVFTVIQYSLCTFIHTTIKNTRKAIMMLESACDCNFITISMVMVSCRFWHPWPIPSWLCNAHSNAINISRRIQKGHMKAAPSFFFQCSLVTQPRDLSWSLCPQAGNKHRRSEFCIYRRAFGGRLASPSSSWLHVWFLWPLRRHVSPNSRSLQAKASTQIHT